MHLVVITSAPEATIASESALCILNKRNAVSAANFNGEVWLAQAIFNGKSHHGQPSSICEQRPS